MEAIEIMSRGDTPGSCKESHIASLSFQSVVNCSVVKLV